MDEQEPRRKLGVHALLHEGPIATEVYDTMSVLLSLFESMRILGINGVLDEEAISTVDQAREHGWDLHSLLYGEEASDHMRERFTRIAPEAAEIARKITDLDGHFHA
jgi:hypothetical protein